jgi:hypothetical protein
VKVQIPRWDLHPGQLRLQASKARFRVAMFGRRWGKNVEAGDEALIAALKGQAVGWFEPTYKYLLEAWRDLVSSLRPVATSISEQEKRIDLINGGVIEFWTADDREAGRSRSYDLVILNEAGIIKDLQPLWEEAVRPTLLDRTGRALFLGTPKNRTHYFSVLHAQAHSRDGWEAFRGPTAENPYIPREELEAAKRDLPPKAYAQEFEGIPADDGANPFGLDAIRKCVVKEAPKGEPVAFGWDFARSQDWTVGIGLSKKYAVVRLHRWQGVPWGEQKARIQKLNGATPAWGDATRSRVDDVIVQDLQRLGTPIIGVPFSQPMKQALMQRLAVCLQEQRLQIPEGPIVSELETFQYEYTRNGVRYCAPEGMHDDCVMALALAVFGRDQFGVMPADPGEPPDIDNRHPGFDVEFKRRKRWYEPEDVAPEPKYVPSPETVPLGW